MFTDGARRRESRLAYSLSIMHPCRPLGLLTSLADRLFATGQSEGVEGQSAADGASKLDRNLVLRQRAVVRLAKHDRYARASGTGLMRSS